MGNQKSKDEVAQKGITYVLSGKGEVAVIMIPYEQYLIRLVLHEDGKDGDIEIKKQFAGTWSPVTDKLLFKLAPKVSIKPTGHNLMTIMSLVLHATQTTENDND